MSMLNPSDHEIINVVSRSKPSDDDHYCQVVSPNPTPICQLKQDSLDICIQEKDKVEDRLE